MMGSMGRIGAMAVVATGLSTAPSWGQGRPDDQGAGERSGKAFDRAVGDTAGAIERFLGAERAGSVTHPAPVGVVGCKPRNANAILQAPCGLALDDAQARKVMDARLVLGGRPDLVTGEPRQDKVDSDWVDIDVLTGSGNKVTTFRMSRSTGSIDPVR